MFTIRSVWLLTPVLLASGALATPAGAQEAREEAHSKPEWVASMRAIHARFNGRPGTFAQFGDSITVTQAFWTPLRYEVTGLSADDQTVLARVRKYLLPECWSDWKGPEYGSEGGMTILWAHQNIDGWLERLNPEVALIMFGTNDLGRVDQEEYTAKTREVVRRCLENGTIVLLSTIPPRSGRLEESRKFAEAIAQIAKEEKVPLVDYFAEVLRRRPDDWDGSQEKFRDVAGDVYQTPTLVCGDGVHPSYPQRYAGDFSEEALSSSGYNLRSHLVLMAYAQILDQVLSPSP